MNRQNVKTSESRQERSDRIAREMLAAERNARMRKTARLRALRLEKESAAN